MKRAAPWWCDLCHAEHPASVWVQFAVILRHAPSGLELPLRACSRWSVEAFGDEGAVAAARLAARVRASGWKGGA